MSDNASIDTWPVMQKRATYSADVDCKEETVVIVGCFTNKSYVFPQFIAVAESGRVIVDNVTRFRIIDPIQAG